MTRRIVDRKTLLTASATAVSAALNVADYRNVCLAIVGSTGCTRKVFVKGAIGAVADGAAPDFTVNDVDRDTTDNWDYVEVVDLEDGAAIDGDTGVALSGNIVRLIEVNTNELDFIAVHVTGAGVGTVTVTAASVTNE